MATLEVGQEIFEATRTFYRGGLKSDNKAFDEDTGISYWDSFMLSSRSLVGDQDAIARLKRIDHNVRLAENRSKGGTTHLRKGFSGKTLWQVGEELYQQKQTIANCGEMSCVAAHIGAMVNKLKSIPKEHFFTKWNKGHQFLVIKGDGPTDDIDIVVDPWLNTCCYWGLYEVFALARLEIWAAKGKRVRFNNKWNVANDPDIKGIWTTLGWSTGPLTDTCG